MYSDLTIVLQGSTLGEYEGKRCIEYSIPSIKKFLHSCKVILSTWEGEEIPENIKNQIDEIVYNKDPGFKTRDCKIKGKPNNVNRQIVSSINGLKKVKTKFAMKMRTDFILTGKKFLDHFDKFPKYEKNIVFLKKELYV